MGNIMRQCQQEMVVELHGDGCCVISFPPNTELREPQDYWDVVTQASDGEPPRGVILDLCDVGYMNSSGLSSLIVLRRHAASAGTGVVLARPNRDIRRLIELAGLASVLVVTDTLEEAQLRLR